MFSQIVLLSHQKLRSCIILILITLLLNRLTKSSSVPSNKFPCLSKWDSILTNISYVVLNFVQTCLLILTTKSLRRMNFFRNYFDHNFLRLSWIESEILNVFTIPLSNDVESKQPFLLHTGTSSNCDTICTLVGKLSTKTNGKIYQTAKNYNRDNWVRSPLPNI